MIDFSLGRTGYTKTHEWYAYVFDDTSLEGDLKLSRCKIFKSQDPTSPGFYELFRVTTTKRRLGVFGRGGPLRLPAKTYGTNPRANLRGVEWSAPDHLRGVKTCGPECGGVDSEQIPLVLSLFDALPIFPVVALYA